MTVKTSLHRPSREEIDELMALTLNWHKIDCYAWIPPVEFRKSQTDPAYMPMELRRCPGFCSDIRLLPSILAAVKKRGVNQEFCYQLKVYDCYGGGEEWLVAWSALHIKPQVLVIAALVALDKWPEKWWRRLDKDHNA